MKFEPNLSPAKRVAYLVAGAGLAAAALFWPDLEQMWRIGGAAAGGITFLEGAIGF